MTKSAVLAWVALACSCGTPLADRNSVSAPSDVSDTVSAAVERLLRPVRESDPASARRRTQEAPSLAMATERMRLYDESYCGCPATDFARDKCSDVLAYGRGPHAVYVPDDDVYHVYQDHKYDGYHASIAVRVSNTDLASTSGAEVTVHYDFMQVHYSYSYDANPKPGPAGGDSRGLELGFYDCETAYESASDMADALCSKDSHAACLDVLVDELFRCSGCCDFFDECYKECEGNFGGYYILEDDDGYEPTLDTSGSGDRCFGEGDAAPRRTLLFHVAGGVITIAIFCCLSYLCCWRGVATSPRVVNASAQQSSRAPIADATVVELPAVVAVSDGTAEMPTAVDVVARPLDDKAIAVAAPVSVARSI